MKLIDEFKQFAMRGNVIDLAVGVIIGGAFGKIVSSFVTDIFMPPLGVLLGGINFSDLKIILKKATAESGAVTLNYGSFLQATVDFFIIALMIFVLIKMINALKKKEKTEKNGPEPTNQERLLREIRDLLKEKKAEGGG